MKSKHRKNTYLRRSCYVVTITLITANHNTKSLTFSQLFLKYGRRSLSESTDRIQSSFIILDLPSSPESCSFTASQWYTAVCHTTLSTHTVISLLLHAPPFKHNLHLPHPLLPIPDYCYDLSSPNSPPFPPSHQPSNLSTPPPFRLSHSHPSSLSSPTPHHLSTPNPTPHKPFFKTIPGMISLGVFNDKMFFSDNMGIFRKNATHDLGGNETIEVCFAFQPLSHPIYIIALVSFHFTTFLSPSLSFQEIINRDTDKADEKMKDFLKLIKETIEYENITTMIFELLNPIFIRCGHSLAIVWAGAVIVMVCALPGLAILMCGRTLWRPYKEQRDRKRSHKQSVSKKPSGGSSSSGKSSSSSSSSSMARHPASRSGLINSSFTNIPTPARWRR